MFKPEKTQPKDMTRQCHLAIETLESRWLLAATLVDFDGVDASGGVVPATGLFDRLGVRFSSVDGPAYVRDFSGFGPQTVFENPSESLTSFPNLLIGSDFGAGRNDIFGDFIDPMTGVPTTASLVEFWALSGPGSDNLSSEVSLTAFDSSGNVIGQSLPPANVQFAFLSLQVAGIASFQYDAGARLDVLDDFSFELESRPDIDVTIDVKPGSDPNSVNLKSPGHIAVAILSTSVADGDAQDFDATTIDTTTIDFGDENLAGRVDPVHLAFEDVDGDGDADLILHFSMTDIQQEDALDADSVDAVIEGETLDGVSFSGMDSIRVVPGTGKPNK